MTYEEKFNTYLKTVIGEHKKVTKLSFLQPDNTVAFELSNNSNDPKYKSSAFIKNGELSVNLQNGIRRTANITLANLDNEFDYNINNLWYGQQVKLEMGVQFDNGEELLFPQGIFYLSEPTQDFTPRGKTISYNLVDKWAYLDGSLFGTLPDTYIIKNIYDDNTRANIFNAIVGLLRSSKYDFSDNAPSINQIDNIIPVFTTYYNNRYYYTEDNQKISMTDIPYEIIKEAGSTLADIILELNNNFAGIIGYDPTGALRIEPSQDDINDSDKPILWNFTPKNSMLMSISENIKNADMYNDIKIIGEGLTEYEEVWGRAQNYDLTSPTNINVCGDLLYCESRAEFWNSEQCKNIAEYMLKRKTALQKNITINCSQMYHLLENRLVSVERTDKPNSPIENHLIQGFTIPLSDIGNMSINAVSVTDFPNLKITSSQSEVIR